MAEIVVGDHENFESALRRFNKKVQADGILAEARRREHARPARRGVAVTVARPRSSGRDEE